MSAGFLGRLSARLLVGGALTSDQAKCQKKAAAAARGLFKVVTRSLEKCHDRVSAGVLAPATDCSLEPATAGKIARARTKVGLKVAASCPDAVLGGLVFGGDCNGLGTAASLASCFADTHEDEALGLMTTLYGAGGAVGEPQIACQKTAAKESVKYVVRRLTAFQKCKDKVSAGKLPGTTVCTADPKTALKVTKAEGKAVAKITASCPDASVAALTFGASCAGVVTSAGLSACILGSHRAAADRLVVIEYGQSAAGGSAVVTQIANPAAECVRGPLARCRAGDYLLDGAPFEGGGSTPVEHPVVIAAYATTTEGIALPTTGAIRVIVTDDLGQPLPARASIVGFDPSRSPRNSQSVFFGIINNSTAEFSDRGADGLPFGLASSIFIDPSGDSGDVPLEPGSYQVVVSRGAEYSDSRQNVTALAFTNPIYVDVDGGGWTAPGVQTVPCP
jgi:hypothetical protein